jgi:acylphosphatase
MNRESLRARVHGQVQGVGFRYFVLRHARRLGLSGFARNLADGSVEVYAEGDHSSLAELAGLLEKGPSGAHVLRVDARYGPTTGDSTHFQIR